MNQFNSFTVRQISSKAYRVIKIHGLQRSCLQELRITKATNNFIQKCNRITSYCSDQVLKQKQNKQIKKSITRCIPPGKEPLSQRTVGTLGAASPPPKTWHHAHQQQVGKGRSSKRPLEIRLNYTAPAASPSTPWHLG